MQTETTSFQDILENTERQKTHIQKTQDKPITATARNLTFGGLSIGGGLMFIMFATQIITGIAAVVLTAVVGIGGFYGIRFLKKMDPLIQQKTKNSAMKWMMEEARKNSIEQLQNLALSKAERLNTARESRNKMKALVMKMKDKIKPENEGSSNHTKKVEMLKRVQDACAQMSKNIDKGAKAHSDFVIKVQEYKDMDSFAEMAGEAMQMFSSSGAETLDEMLSLEAFDSIETDFNEAIISIESSAHDYAIDNEGK
jgi:hypothetical protein